jgi:hypothetical protein
MGANDKTPNQANYQTNQNYNIDINQVFNDFIGDIDKNRSVINIQVNTVVLNAPFDIKTIASLGRYLKVENTSQESRAHAFYRLIGFPVVDQDQEYYNPGLDTVQGVRKIDLVYKIKVANNQDPLFKTLSLQRENYVNNFLNAFNTTPTTITASALALSSGATVRPFTPLITNFDPFDFTPTNQQYTVNLNSIVGKNQVPLTQYSDAFNNFPIVSTSGSQSASLGNTRFHFSQPYIVDARIDFTISPATRKVAVPFVDNKKNLLVAENVYVNRPLLEKVIRDRIGQDQDAVISPAQQQVIDYILQIPTIKNDSLIGQMVGNIYNTGTQVQFEKYLFIIQAMCVKLVEAQLKIQKVQALYYWLPQPSSIGPEGGSDIYGLIISQNLSKNLITIADQSLINSTLQQAADNFDTQTAPIDGVPNLGGFAFDAFSTTFDSDTSTSLGDNVSKNLNNLNTKRNAALTIANTALQTIEVIMGEWSGLGLCDIVAVMGALYTMPQDSLLGFLDADAFDRMIVALNLESNNLTNPGISQALTDFVSRVNEFYNLTQDIYANIAQNNGLTI